MPQLRGKIPQKLSLITLNYLIRLEGRAQEARARESHYAHMQQPMDAAETRSASPAAGTKRMGKFLAEDHSGSRDGSRMVVTDARLVSTGPLRAAGSPQVTESQ